MTEAMPFLQKYDITFLRPPTICAGRYLVHTVAYGVKFAHHGVVVYGRQLLGNIAFDEPSDVCFLR